MTNLEIKKEVLKATRRIEDFNIVISIWHGDGVAHDGYDVIYSALDLYSGDEELEHGISIGNFEDPNDQVIENDENLVLLRTEQRKLWIYLKKHFDNVECREVIV